MSSQNELTMHAKALTYDQQKAILTSFQETKLHTHVKSLLEKIYPANLVEITHGDEEFGKDLVMVGKDPFVSPIIGFVVKKGAISGKTSGDVDDIKTKIRILPPSPKIRDITSQIEQAFDNPAILKTVYKELPVTEVRVMLFGELSRQARIRIKSETGIRDDCIFDLKQLIDMFIDHYPQVFFEGRILDFIQKKTQALETKHIFSGKGKTLSESFVSPLVATIDIPQEFSEESFSLIIEKGKRFPFASLQSILNPGKRIILAGDPGTGKSMALSHLMVDILKEASTNLIKASSTKPLEMPILITASDFLGFGTTEELVNDQIKDVSIRNRSKIKLLMIDGLDEIPVEQRSSLLNTASDFSTQLRCPLLVTTRKIDILKNLPIGFEKYELLSFEIKQALSLFGKFISDPKLLQNLKIGLERMEHQIPMTPLSLMLLIELVEQHDEIPASITELYDRFSSLMLGKWDEGKGLSVLFDYRIKRRFLAELAHHEFLSKKRMEISKAELHDFLVSYADRYGGEVAKLSSFLDEITRAGLLDTSREPVIFCHRSFLDYFGACYIFDERENIENLDDLIVRTYYDDSWGDVAFFYIGLKTRITNSILDKVFDVREKNIVTYMNKFTIGRLLQAGWQSPAEIKHKGIEKSIDFGAQIRDELQRITKKNRKEFPKIFADYLVMFLAELSFSSGFLVNEARSLLNGFTNQLSQNNIYNVLSLLWGSKNLLSVNELEGYGNKVLDALPSLDLIVQDEYRTLLLLLRSVIGNPAISKTIERKLDKLQDKYPEQFKTLLPYRKKR